MDVAARNAKSLMAVHVAVGTRQVSRKSETARRCREYVLNHALGDPSRPDVKVEVNQTPTTLGLTPDDMKLLAERHGGRDLPDEPADETCQATSSE